MLSMMIKSTVTLLMQIQWNDNFKEIENKYNQGQDEVAAILDEKADKANTTISDDIKYMRLNVDKVLETSTDGVEFEATGSSGHLILDQFGTTMPQRSRLKFENTIVTDAPDETIVSGGCR